MSDDSNITYTVWYSTNDKNPPSNTSHKTDITGSSTILSRLEKGTMYFIWVAAVSSEKQGPNSTIGSQTTYNGIICTLYNCLYKNV